LLIIRIWNYFRGYVIIKIEGLTLEKFINLSIAKGIYLWDIIRCDYTTIEAKISIKGFMELKEVVRKVGCRVKILEKKGYPFIIHRLKYRKMLAFGSIIAIAIIFFMTSFIWSIDVVGNENVGDDIIISQLEKMEVRPGIRKGKVDLVGIKKGLLTDIDLFAYTHVEIKGTKLIVDVREKESSNEAIAEEVPCNIISKKKAVIEKVVAKNGKSVVEKGDIVKEGEILITGIITDERLENPLYVHADGYVIGITRYSEVIEEPIIKSIEEETGKEYVTREVRLGNKRLQFMNGDIPFQHYIEQTTVKKIINNDSFSLPIEVVIHTYKEVKLSKVKQNLDSLKKLTSVNGVKKIMDSLPENVEVLSKDVNYSVSDNILTTNIIIEVKEEIGVKKRIE